MATFHEHSVRRLVDSRHTFADTWYNAINAFFSNSDSSNLSTPEFIFIRLSYIMALDFGMNFIHGEVTTLKFIHDFYLDEQRRHVWWPILLRILAGLVTIPIALTVHSNKETLGLRAVDIHERFDPAASTYAKLIGIYVLEYCFVRGGTLLYGGLPAWPPPPLDRSDIAVPLYRAFAVVVITQPEPVGLFMRLGIAINGYLMLQAYIAVAGCIVATVAGVVAFATGIGKAVAADLYWPEGLEKRGMETDDVGNAASAVREDGVEEVQVRRVE
ncbi:hypothetical protein LTR56_005170 [Elasticomyces elasticus]|nr:hypothetical protein LTR56_005170 [Elasticomyces elasticus]KAK3659625.1 hypothetical protein LTR22_008356 [Elasticomyces elasticus]